MRYDRTELYHPKPKEKKKDNIKNEEKTIDWLNIVLLILLFIIGILYFTT